MTCHQVQECLLLYLADELPARDRECVHRHLTHCAACYDHAAELLQTEGRLQAVLEEELRIPDTLQERVMSAVRDLPAPRRPWSWTLRFRPAAPAWRPVAAAACVAALAFGAGHWSATHHRSPAGAAAEFDLLTLGAVHQRLDQGGEAELRAPGPEPLSAALTPRVGFPVQPVDLRPEATHLVGGQELKIVTAPVAYLHYQWRGARVSLFQMDARRLAPPGLRQMPARRENYVAERKDGLSYVAWRSGGVNCVLVSREMPMHLLFQLACHACERQERSVVREQPG